MEIRANYEGQTLENKIAVEIQEANQAIAQLRSNITGLKSTINSVAKNTGIKTLAEQTAKANKATSSWSKTWSALQKTINFSAIYLGAKQALSTLKEMTNASVDYTETVNLFNVSFGKGIEGLNQYYENAINFQEELEEKLGVNIEESMRYQALFNSMTKSMGLNAEKAYTLSENMTKLGYDLASLYNISPDSAMTKLRAGLAGQTEPLRELGLDITEQSLKPVAESLGIEESIRNMSQAEKAVLRYIAVLRQAQIAQGDFARTMDSPANQLRIFNAQLEAFKRNVGNLWSGLLGNILPYVNAIMMVINELLKMVAELFGFEISTQPVNISASVSADDLADDLGTASGEAKKLRKQLMGFDEINNITLDTGNSGGSAGGTTGTGIDQRLLDALKGYDNLMDSITNKATELRDKMLEWLGFERDDDGTWKLKEGLTNFEKILDVVKMIGIAFGTWKISSTITNLFKNLGKINKTQAFQLAFGITLTATGIFAQYKGTSHLLDGDIDLFTLLETFLGTAGGAFGIVSILKATKKGKKLLLGNKLKFGFGIMLGIQGIQVFLDGITEGDVKKSILGAIESVGALTVAFNGLFGKNLITSIKNTAGSIGTFGIGVVKSFKDARASGLSLGKSFKEAGKQAMDLIPTSVKVAGGIAGIVTSCVSSYNALQGLKEGTKSTGEALTELAGSVATAAASGAMIGSVFGPVGTVIGALTGALISGASAWMGYNSNIAEAKEKVSEMTQELESSKQAYEAQLKAINDNQATQLIELELVGKLKDELTNLVDANGKVKKGYEKRVDYILNEVNEALGTEYSRNGDVIDSYKEMIGTIDDLIDEKKRKIKLEAQEEIYKESLKKEQELQSKLNEAIKERDDLYEQWQEKSQNVKNYKDIFEANALHDQLEQARENVKTIQSEYTTASQNVMEAEYSMLENTVASMTEITDETLANNEEVFGALVTSADEYTAEFVEKLQTLTAETRANLLSQLNEVTAVKPEILEEWKRLATDSTTEFKTGISTMPADVQATILTSVTTIDNLDENMIEAWSNMGTLSATDFANAINEMPVDVQATILASITKTEGLTDKTKQAWLELADKSATEYEKALSQVDETTAKEIKNAVATINRNKKASGESGKELGEEINTKFEKGLGDGTDAADNWLGGFKTRVSNPRDLFDTVSGIGTSIVSVFNSALGNASPSKKTKKSAQYFIEGFRNQLKRMLPSSLNQVKDLGISLTSEFDRNLCISQKFSGIEINSKDFSVDTNQFVDYGKIDGIISMQSNIDNNLPQQIYNAVIEGMRNSKIQVDIEAKTDKGIMFRTIKNKAEEYAIQTGENPFPVLI